MTTPTALTDRNSTPIDVATAPADSRTVSAPSRWQFAQNLVASYGFYFSGYLLSFLVVPYLARILGPSHWGVFALTQTFAMYIILVVDCGFAFSATKVVARNRERPEVLSEVLAGVWSSKVVLALFSVCAAFVATRIAPVFRDHLLLFWCGVAWGVLQGANMNWYYQGLERMRTAAMVDISIKSAAIVLTILLVRTPEAAWLALALNATACLISLIVLTFLAYREVSPRWPTWQATKHNLKTGVHAFLPRNSFLVSSLSGVFMLGLFAPPAVLGLFAGAERISRAVTGLLVPLTDALYSRINRIVATSPQSFLPVAKRLMLAMGGCGLAMGVAVYLAAPLMVRILLGAQFGAAVTTLRIFALLGPLIALGNTLGAHWMLSLGMDRQFAAISLASAAFTIVLCPVVAAHFGASGVAWIIVLSQVLITAAAYVAVSRRRQDSHRLTAQPNQEGSSPEWNLLFTIARCQLDAPARERLETLARAQLDWARLPELAAEHGVLPLLHRHLVAVCPHCVPPGAMKAMAARVFGASSRNLFMTAELARVVGLLETGGVAVIPFKGPILAHTVYRDISLRLFGDLDILVRPSDLKRARQILTANGYLAEFSDDAEESKYIQNAEKVIRFIKRQGSVVIEMHWEFAPRNMGFPHCATPQLWERRQNLSFGGKVMTVLSPEDVALQLCFHGAKHCWDKLEWISSLSELIRTQPKMNWPWIHAYARDCHSRRILHLGLALARTTLGSLPPHVGLEELDPVSEKLAQRVLRNMASASREHTRQAPYRYWFYLQAKDRVRDGVRMLFLASGQALRPKQLRRAYRTPRLDRMRVADTPPNAGRPTADRAQTLEANPKMTIDQHRTEKSAVAPEAIRRARPSLFRIFLNFQQDTSVAIDRLLPESYRIDGAKDFMENVVPAYVPRSGIVYDVGGGKHPVLSPAQKSAASVWVVGLDIDAEELAQAPAGCYDSVVRADISRFTGNSDADAVLCASVIEHVRDTRAALRSVASILRIGGQAVFYVPCRNAVFARLNLAIPEKLKRALLSLLIPASKGYCGFQAFYDQCTPSAFVRAAREAGLEVELLRPYWYSPYFTWFAPAFLIWRGWGLLTRAAAGPQAAEAFAIVLKRVR